ncbi:possible lipase/acylhydrolase (GDSL family) [Aurantimonas manganoxydans SI85-9A1]|uniref:Possible lipase/acylhydrolase (GDSL family) n=1 Tax=Aurantimonas manganoxydans (strain ATCC BAA-1229 / DSM 21871 / SI85-9A1) TaxID=287752 RepID=Q1YKL3_AURMS|nr:SGNH/GDSL hydrolase family protein [Aurantimonas manganoxydans]EAS50510.1 possible lipase/acylhydrolase (GDSL family) [Aurantimonas manganoxydans SI85-9A1]
MAIGDAFLSWLLFPVYVWQGLGVRRRVERMVPPAGRHSGLCGTSSGTDAPIRLLVIGDSSAAGVGVDVIEDSLAPKLAERLYALSGRDVLWRAAGSNSAVSADIRDHVVPHLDEPFTHIVLMIGTNDAKNFHGTLRFKKAFGTLLYALKAKWPDARIVWSPPVDLKRVPALPRGLATVLELRARIVRRMGARLCAERGAISATTLPRVEPAGFSRDGFHASIEGYAYVANHLVTYVVGDAAAWSTGTSAGSPETAPD